MNQPNILMIMTDQHRLSAVGAYGETPCQTPHIDALAARGVRFDNAYCPTAICSPTRASVLTGMLPHRHGMTANIGDLGCNQQHIADHPDLLSRRLQAAGYRCGYTGKWHLCAERNKRTRFQADYVLNLPSDLGFEGHDIPGHGGGGWDSDPYQGFLTEQGHQLVVDRASAGFGHEAGVVRSDEATLVPAYLADHTIELMDRFQADRAPWFIWHNFWGPHEPYFATPRWLDYYSQVEIPPWPDCDWPAAATAGPHQRWLTLPTPAWSHWAELIRHYYACTSFIDEQIGRMVAHLEASGALANTWVVVTADHGESLGSHGGLANKGAQPFEEVLRVPLIIHGPDLRAGSVRQELVANMDLFATVCAAAGVPCDPHETASKDLGPLCRGEELPWRDCWVSQSHGVSGMLFTQRVLRWQQWSYAWTAGYPELLFDLTADPHQLTNLATDDAYGAQLTACRQRLRQWLGDELDPARVAFDHEQQLWAAGHRH